MKSLLTGIFISCEGLNCNFDFKIDFFLSTAEQKRENCFSESACLHKTYRYNLVSSKYLFKQRDILKYFIYLCRNLLHTCIRKLGHFLQCFLLLLLLLLFIVMLFLLHLINFVVYTIFLYAICKSFGDL